MRKCDSNRLAGAVLVAPVINYWWSDLPANLSNEAYYQKPLQDRWALSIAHYTPWLTYWWNTQRWFPASSFIAHNLDVLSPEDKKLIPKLSFRKEYVVCILIFPFDNIVSSLLSIQTFYVVCYIISIHPSVSILFLWRNREIGYIEELIKDQTLSLVFEQLVVYRS